MALSPGARPRTDPQWISAALVLVIAGLCLLSLLTGAGDTPPSRVLEYLLGASQARSDAQLSLVVADLRLPRTVIAVLVGSSLAAGGVLLQAVTRNPLAETGLLGVNSGAALGVVIGITSTGADTGGEFLAWGMAGAFAASAVVLGVAASGRGVSPLRLLLAGIAIGATLRGISSLVLLRDAATFDNYRFWVLGSLSGSTMDMALHVVPAVLAGLAIAVAVVRPLSALGLGDDAARVLGHRPAVVRVVVAVAVTLLAASAVALAGPIAFLGLVAPWFARAITGPRVGAQLAVATLGGAALMLVADVLARVVARPYEAPASIFLGLAGAPLLIWIARTGRLAAR